MNERKPAKKRYFFVRALLAVGFLPNRTDRAKEPSIGTSLASLSSTQNLAHARAHLGTTHTNGKSFLLSARGHPHDELTPETRSQQRYPSVLPFATDPDGRGVGPHSRSFHLKLTRSPATAQAAAAPFPSTRSLSPINPPASRTLPTNRTRINLSKQYFHLCAVPSRPAPPSPQVPGTRAPCRRTSP